MGDVRIISGGQNAGEIIAATVEDASGASGRKPVHVLLCNISGDAVNPSAGSSGGDGAINDGADSGIKATVKNYAASKPLAVVLVNVSGDVYNTGGGGSGGDGAINDGVSSSVKATVLQGPTARPGGSDNPLLIQFADDPTRQVGRTSPPVTGSQVVGGSIGAQVQPSGDFPVRLAAATAALGITGDVSVKPSTGQTFPVTQSGAWSIQGSGDLAIVDGANRAVKATVRDYANANPLAVALTNASGDTYSPAPREPIVVTRSGRVTSAGTTTVAGPYDGRVIKVLSYDIQAEADTAQARWGSNASGEALSPQWLLGAREGVAKQVSPVGGGYFFKTQLNQSLVLENAGANFRYSVSFHTGDSI